MKRFSSKLAILTLMTTFLLNANIYAQEITATEIMANEVTTRRVASPDNVAVEVNGVALSFGENEKPYLKNGSTMIPLRKTVEALGAYNVNWYTDLKTASFIYNGNRFEVLAKNSAEVKNGKTFIPVRFITEKLGVKVNWQQENYTVAIEAPKEPETEFTKEGRPIRITNLPKDVKFYSFILKDVENAMYEAPYINLRKTNVELQNDVWLLHEGNLEKWTKIINDNLNLRLNVDYENLSPDYAKKLSVTFGDYRDMPVECQKYADWVKKNHIKIKSAEIRTEPTTCYEGSGTVIRSYVKFQIVSFDKNENVMFEANCPQVHKGWYEGYVDIPVSTNSGASNGEDLTVNPDRSSNILISPSLKYLK